MHLSTVGCQQNRCPQPVEEGIRCDVCERECSTNALDARSRGSHSARQLGRKRRQRAFSVLQCQHQRRVRKARLTLRVPRLNLSRRQLLSHRSVHRGQLRHHVSGGALLPLASQPQHAASRPRRLPIATRTRAPSSAVVSNGCLRWRVSLTLRSMSAHKSAWRLRFGCACSAGTVGCPART